MGDAVRVRIGDDFFETLEALQPVEQMRVTKAVNKFKNNPESNGLNLEQIRRDKSCRLFTIRGSDELRVLLARIGDEWVFLEAGHHDDIYLRAKSGHVFVRSDGGLVGFVAGGDDEDRRPRHKTNTIPEQLYKRVFDHWTDAELRSVGFTDREVAVLRPLTSHAALLDSEIDDEKLLLAIDLVEVTPEQWAAERSASNPSAVKQRRESKALEAAAVWGLSEVLGEQELERILAAPIEDWMLFLHPQQRSITTANYNGPARIFGAAGTGKTVVALHRAAELANRFRQTDPEAVILFTTFIKSLPSVYESLYDRLPNSIQGAVEFISVDKLARRVANTGPKPGTVKIKQVDEAFRTAFKAVVKKDSPLAKLALTQRYLREECDAVIKGRGIEQVEQYLMLDRVGRRTPLNATQRKEVWRLHTRWCKEMKKAKTVCFADVRIAAKIQAEQEPTAQYRAAIVDEAQDLSLVGLQLIQALVSGNNAPESDNMLLVGDGAQRIYASCFTLKEAGIDVRNRSNRLGYNYRNSAEIVAVAKAIAGDHQVEDLDETFTRGDALAPSDLHSAKPEYVISESESDMFDKIAEGIAEFVRRGRANYGDVAVLAADNRGIHRIRNELRERALPTIDLKDGVGTTTPEVRIGTYHRSKGLEFKVVFLPWITQDRIPPLRKATESEDSYQERCDLFMSALFVAMTRARDHLILLGEGEPSELVSQAGAVIEIHTPPG